MLPVEYAISRCRRDLTLSAAVRFALAGGAAGCLFLAPFLGQSFNSGLVLLAIGTIWMVLSIRSARGSQMAQSSPSLIASGQWEQAEQQIEQSLCAFSLFRTSKLLSLHHLAMLRHAQNRYRDSAMLCRAILGQRLGALSGLSKSSRLILADALLEMGDLRGAYDAFIPLHQERLRLAEAVQLLLIELDYDSRISDWDHMMSGISTKVQLAELMPARNSALAQALLALAAHKTGREDWNQWLRRRATLLVDADKLLADRAILKDIF